MFLTILIKIFTLFGKSSELLAVFLETNKDLLGFRSCNTGRWTKCAPAVLSCMQKSCLWMESVYCLLACRWLTWNNLKALMQYPLAECQFCQVKKVLVIDIRINVFVKGPQDWMDLKTDLRLQLWKFPLRGRGALMGGMRAGSTHVSASRYVCFVGRQQAHLHQWACYLDIFMKSEFVMGLFLSLLLYLAENLSSWLLPK